MFDSVFHASDFDKISSRNLGGLLVKSNLSPRNGFVVLRQVKTIRKEELSCSFYSA